MNESPDISNKVVARQQDDLPFCGKPGESYTMPARFYTDSTVYGLEMEKIFFCNWIYVGHASQFGSSGDYLTTRINDQNLLVIRSRSGALRAVHRGTSCCVDREAPI